MSFLQNRWWGKKKRAINEGSDGGGMNPWKVWNKKKTKKKERNMKQIKLATIDLISQFFSNIKEGIEDICTHTQNVSEMHSKNKEKNKYQKGYHVYQ